MTNIGCCKKLIRFLTFIKLSTYISLFRNFHIPTFKHKPTMSYSKTQPPDFPPKGSRHFVSNFLLSAGILAQYKTFNGEI